MTDLQTLVPDYAEAERFLPLKPDWCHGDQSLDDAATLIAFAKRKSGGRFLEIGTSAGEGAAALIYGGRDGGTTLTGIDFAERVYYEKSKPVGAVVGEALPEIAERYTILAGAMSNAVLARDERYDLVHIDAAHSHPWAVIDLLCAMVKLRPGALVAFHDANYTAALSQAAYYFSRVHADHGRFIGNHFVFRYDGPDPVLIAALLRSIDMDWQASVPPEVLVDLHAGLNGLLEPTDSMSIMSRLLARNALFHENAEIYEAVRKGLWQRELERRRLLAEARKQS